MYKFVSLSSIKAKINPQNTIILLLVTLCIILGFLYLEERRTSENVLSESQESRLLHNIEKLIITPVNEKPTIATIVDPSSLKSVNNNFYKDAQAGDKLVVWPNKAVIYRESDDIIVNALLINTGNVETLKNEDK